MDQVLRKYKPVHTGQVYDQVYYHYLGYIRKNAGHMVENKISKLFVSLVFNYKIAIGVLKNV